jgi:hypothetical protein
MRLRKNVVVAKDGGKTWAVMGMHEVVGYRQTRGETKKECPKKSVERPGDALRLFNNICASGGAGCVPASHLQTIFLQLRFDTMLEQCYDPSDQSTRL